VPASNRERECRRLDNMKTPRRSGFVFVAQEQYLPASAESTLVAIVSERTNVANLDRVAREIVSCSGVLGDQPFDERGDARDGVYAADALPTSPDIAPRLGRRAREVHLRRIAGRQVVGIEAGVDDRRLEVVAEHAGEQVGVDDVGGGGLDDRGLVALGGACLVGGD